MKYKEKTEPFESLDNKRNDKLWEERFHVLESFIEEFGRLPKQKETYRGDNIGRWYAAQKRLCKNIDYPKNRREKIERMESLGKTTYDELWEDHFLVFEQFAAEFDRLPKTKEEYHGDKIGIWYDNQKKIYNNAEYPEKRRKKLKQIENLYKASNDEIWEDHFRVFAQFVEVFGRLPKTDETYLGNTVGMWYARQKYISKKENYPEERRKKLEQFAAFDTVPNDEAWESHYQLLLDFIEKFGRLPKQKETYLGDNIGKWFANQKQQVKEENYPEEHRAKIEKFVQLSISNNNLDDMWDAHYQVVLKFIDNYCRLPNRNESYDGDHIGEWYAYQKKQIKKTSYPDNRREKLNQLHEMAKGQNDTQWENNYRVLEQYVQEFHRMPTQGKIYNETSIGIWYANQKRQSKKESYPEERRKKLEELGKKADLRTVHDVQWEKSYQVLKQFVEKFHRLPKQLEVYNGTNIGTWCATQKRNCKKDTYSEERKQLLREIGLIK